MNPARTQMAKGQKAVQEVWKELEAARQEREHSSKKFDPIGVNSPFTIVSVYDDNMDGK